MHPGKQFASAVIEVILYIFKSKSPELSCITQSDDSKA